MSHSREKEQAITKSIRSNIISFEESKFPNENSFQMKSDAIQSNVPKSMKTKNFS